MYTGYNGDFLSAVQLISPQVEAIVRHRLSAVGNRTSGLRRGGGVEDEWGLPSLVRDGPMDEVFAPDVALAIRALFCGDGGMNLRNDTAHGLLTDTARTSAHNFYAWWLVEAPASEAPLPEQ